MQRNQHSNEFKEQALSKVRARGSRTLQSMATELNMSLGTLKGWLKRSGLEGTGLLRGEGHEMTLPGDVPARLWSPVQRLLALQESHALSGPALHAWVARRRACSSINWCSGAMPSAHPLRRPPATLPTPPCASCKAGTPSCSARCFARTARWRRPRPCWSFKKSFKRWSCSNRRERTNEHPQTASNPAGADR